MQTIKMALLQENLETIKDFNFMISRRFIFKYKDYLVKIISLYLKFQIQICIGTLYLSLNLDVRKNHFNLNKAHNFIE